MWGQVHSIPLRASLRERCRLRLDLFLKWSRVIARRSLAKATCDAGKVAINDQVARAGHVVRAGDVISVFLPHRFLKFQVSSLPAKTPRKSDSRAMIEILEERILGDTDD